MFLHPWRENNGQTTLMFFQHLTFPEKIMHSAQTLNRLVSFSLCASYTSPVQPPHIFIIKDYYYLDGFFEVNKVNSNHKVSIFKISFPRVNWMHGFYAPDTFPFSYLESLFLLCGFWAFKKKKTFIQSGAVWLVLYFPEYTVILEDSDFICGDFQIFSVKLNNAFAWENILEYRYKDQCVSSRFIAFILFSVWEQYHQSHR